MMASALENNGATVYLVGRRLEVVEKAARDNNVRHFFLLSSGYGRVGRVPRSYLSLVIFGPNLTTRCRDMAT